GGSEHYSGPREAPAPRSRGGRQERDRKRDRDEDRDIEMELRREGTRPAGERKQESEMEMRRKPKRGVAGQRGDRADPEHIERRRDRSGLDHHVPAPPAPLPPALPV